MLDTNTLTIDFGTVAANSGAYQSGFAIFNLPGLDPNFTVTFESTSITGGTPFLYANLSPTEGLAAGESLPGIASLDTTGLTPGLYSATIRISGLDDAGYLALVNAASGGAELPAGYDPGDLTLTLQGQVIPEPATAVLLSVFGLVWLLRRPRRALAGS